MFALVFLRYKAFTPDSFWADLLSGLFDVGPVQSIWISACAAFLVASAIIATDITIRYAPDRFNVLPLPDWLERGVKTGTVDPKSRALTWRSVVSVVIYTVASLYLLCGMSASPVIWLPAYIAVYVGLWLYFRSRYGLLFRNPRWLRDKLRALTQWSPEGYSEDRDGKTTRERADMTDDDIAAPTVADSMLVYHAGAFCGLFAAWLFYVASFALVNWTSLELPALASLVLLLTLLCWTLSAVTFWLDRARLPILLFVLLVLTLVPDEPYTFQTATLASSAPLPTANDVVKDAPRFIAVAASGGGIHASGWTARVLGGIYLALPTDELKRRFAGSIRMVSPVSGGSVGTLYFLNTSLQDDFRDGTMTGERLTQTLFEPSTASSLDAIAQGLIFQDFWRLINWGALGDRGRAAERAWTTAIDPVPATSSLYRPLAWWGDKANAGLVPAVLFNATIADTGERAVFSTVGLGGRPNGGRRFREMSGRDVPLVTAARLSATFPIITPAARPDAGTNPGFNFVDGGYYDTYGMSTLIEWLSDLLGTTPRQKVLVLQIRDAPKFVPGKSRDESGFLFQTFVPVRTLERFRNAGQVAHGELEMKLLSDRYATGVVDQVVFDWPFGRTPLSWHLTAAQKMEIERAIGEDVMRPLKRQVCVFLAGDDARLSAACDAIR